MATLAGAPSQPQFDSDSRERRFYLRMAWTIGGIVLAGFGGYILAGISSFSAPWWVHVHAVSYMAWIVLFLNQNLLVVRGDFAAHRRMGMVMAALALWMVLVGSVLLFASVAAHRAPPVFSVAMLFAMDELGIFIFAGLVAAGIALRRRSDWHKRLMLGATILLIHPAVGRLTVLTIGFSWPVIILALLALVAIAAGFDWRNRGKVHPALLLVGGIIAAYGLTVPLLAQLPALNTFANTVAAGG